MRYSTEVVLITGRKGAGKSTLARHLLRNHPEATRRAIVLDSMGDYPQVPGTDDLREFAEAWKEVCRDDAYRLAIRSHRTEEQIRALELVYEVQRQEDLGPVLVVMEEASLFSDTHSIPGPVERAVSKGRHAGISMLAVCQRSAQVHPILQQSADTICCFASRKTSSWIGEIFPKDDLARIRSLETIEGPLEEGHVPERGVHYVTDPPDADVADRLERALDQ